MIFRILFSFILGVYLTFSSVVAQQNYTLLPTGDYKEIIEKPEYQPDAKISGHYKAFYTTRRSSLSNTEDSINRMGQEIELRIRSQVNRHISVNATIRNLSTNFEDQKTGYYSDDPNEQSDASQDTGFILEFKEAFLEYNYNPSAILRFGRQYIEIGNDKGFIYSGEATGFSQDCTIGTWCFSIGGVRMDLKGDDTLYWAQLDYPVYDNGVTVKDLWNDREDRPESSLNVEFFRVPYHGSDIPAAFYGGNTGNNSLYHDTSNSLAVYFDNKKVEYTGFQVQWNYYQLMLDFNFITLTGDRIYHTGTANEKSVVILQEQQLSGEMAALEFSYNLDKEWQMGIDLLQASGTKQTTLTEKSWEKDSESYFEVQKGAYGKAQIYFNGLYNRRDGYINNRYNRGDGHSISNLESQSLNFQYRDLRETLAIEIAYYNFKRNVSVLNKNGEFVQDIGREVNISSRWYLEPPLSVQLSVATLQPGEAYAANDNLVPTGENENIWAIGFDLFYHF